MEIKNVILYCRVSTEEQEKGSSLNWQEDYLRRYCGMKHYNVVAVYKEDKSAKFLRRDFNYTRFEQTLMLPESIDREAITAKAKHGVLKITLPKLQNIPEKEPTRVIEIQ